jgi:hypothetical protein
LVSLTNTPLCDGRLSWAEGEEMTVTGLRELEEVAVKLEANARKLPTGPIRDELLQDIAIFRAQVAALQAAALRPSGEGLKAKGK